MERIWICGSNGRLGKALEHHLNPIDAEIISTDIDTLDVSDCDEVILFARRNRPTVIINCAGVTNHQYCQDHPEEAYRVNGLGARNVAVAAQLINAQLIHLSTDQVFGQHIDGPCKECDQASPLSIFGKSKLFGEEMVSRVCPHHFIIRTSWLYSNENHMVEKVLEPKFPQNLSNAQKEMIKNLYFTRFFDHFFLDFLLLSLYNRYNDRRVHNV